MRRDLVQISIVGLTHFSSLINFDTTAGGFY